MNRSNLTRILVAITISIFLIGFYQNCAKKAKNFKSSESLNQEIIEDLYSQQDQVHVEQAHEEIKNANLDVYDVLTVHDSFEKSSKEIAQNTQTFDFNQFLKSLENSQTLTLEQLQQAQVQALQALSEIINKFLKGLSGLPTLTTSERVSLNNAISELRKIKEPQTNDRVLKTFLILIEIKQIIFQAIWDNNNLKNETIEQKYLRNKAMLTSLKKLILEIVSDLEIIRPTLKVEISVLKPKLNNMMDLIINPQAIIEEIAAASGVKISATVSKTDLPTEQYLNDFLNQSILEK